MHSGIPSRCSRTHQVPRQDHLPSVCTYFRRRPHRKIKTKVNTLSYESLEVFDQDVRAALLQEPSHGDVATVNDLDDGDSGESKGPAAEKGAAEEGATAKSRKEALTTEFVARLKVDRANVEGVIRAREARNRMI